eukprot:TRINITY_DN10039_c0_g1_i1.p1 TRINITY_DN10039_c0_g1~~TRINITY_DN10039_c0_g1_i1.p1  ORF type:complete len:315 (-),score=-6.89 TRINITY_DN10039_c0_g1_i1:12-956(-)
MGLTTRELMGYITSFTIIHSIYNFIVLAVLAERDGRTIGGCNSNHEWVSWWISGWTWPTLLFSFIFAVWATISATRGDKNAQASFYRKSQRLSLLAIFTASWALFGLYYDVGVATGHGQALRRQSHATGGYCYFSIPFAVDAAFLGWFFILPVQCALYHLCKAMIRSLEPDAAEISLFDSAMSAGRKAVSFIRRGRKGLTKTVFLAKRFVKSSIRVKRQHDDIFREVDFSTLLLRSFTLHELKDAIGARFDMPSNDIRYLLKNGNVVIENDDDVARLTSTDYIDVVFGNALPFEPIPDRVPAYAPFNASLSQIV